MTLTIALAMLFLDGQPKQAQPIAAFATYGACVKIAGDAAKEISDGLPSNVTVKVICVDTGKIRAAATANGNAPIVPKANGTEQDL
jgi:hypothetical protein